MSGVKIEIVTIGDELLLGQTIDSNAAWMGRRFAAAGLQLVRHITVGDDAVAIRAAIAEALDRTGTAVCCGGLGPTADDITREVAAAMFGRRLEIDDVILAQVEQRFRSHGLEMPASSASQALVPEGARVFPNARGTAPGLALEDAGGRVAVLLPGVPHELRGLIDDHVLMFLLERAPDAVAPTLFLRVRTTGLTESAVADRVEPVLPTLAPLRVAFLPSFEGVDLRITSWGEMAEADAWKALHAAANRLVERLGPAVYAVGDRSLVDVVSDELEGAGLTLAVAESCTGGLVAARVTDRPGASSIFLGGVVAYANSVKENVLTVPEPLLAEHGAVSEETARAMVDGVRALTGASAAVAVTGIAGPTGGSAEKPVGTVWIAAAVRERSQARRHLFPGEREQIRARAAQAALALLHQLISTTS